MRSFGAHTATWRVRIHKASDIAHRPPKWRRAGVRPVRQAWELDDAEKAKSLLRNLSRRQECDASGLSPSTLEGFDEILTATRLGLPTQPRRSLACPNIVEITMRAMWQVGRDLQAPELSVDAAALECCGYAGDQPGPPQAEGT